MKQCYRDGGCGPYENRPCNECPASKPEYMLKQKNISIFVCMLNGEVKDNYMTIAFSEEEAKQKIIDTYFKEKNHTEKELDELGIYITVVPFNCGKTVAIY